MTWKEFEETMRHASKNGNTNLRGVIVFKPESFERDFSEKERSYEVTSGAKYFDEGKIGKSLFGDSLDGSDTGVRLDWYMHALPEDNLGKRWIVDYCYLLDDEIKEKKEEDVVADKEYMGIKYFDNKDGWCPVCNKQLYYGVVEHVDGDMEYYPWECENCGTRGEAWFKEVFKGHTVITSDTDDNIDLPFEESKKMRTESVDLYGANKTNLEKGIADEVIYWLGELANENENDEIGKRAQEVLDNSEEVEKIVEKILDSDDLWEDLHLRIEDLAGIDYRNSSRVTESLASDAADNINQKEWYNNDKRKQTFEGMIADKIAEKAEELGDDYSEWLDQGTMEKMIEDIKNCEETKAYNKTLDRLIELYIEERVDWIRRDDPASRYYGRDEEELNENKQQKYTLSEKDIAHLKRIGYEDKDIPQIEEALNKTVYMVGDVEKDEEGRLIIPDESLDRSISAQEAREILGDQTFLNGLSRSAFHWNSARYNADDTKYVTFDSSKLFEESKKEEGYTQASNAGAIKVDIMGQPIKKKNKKDKEDKIIKDLPAQQVLIENKESRENDVKERIKQAKEWKKRIRDAVEAEDLEEIADEILEATEDIKDINYAGEDIYSGFRTVMDNADAYDRGPVTYVRSVKLNMNNILDDFIDNYEEAFEEELLDESKEIKTEDVAINNGFNITNIKEVEDLANEIAEKIKEENKKVTIDTVIKAIEGYNKSVFEVIKGVDGDLYNKIDDNPENEDNRYEAENQFLGLVEDILNDMGVTVFDEYDESKKVTEAKEGYSDMLEFATKLSSILKDKGFQVHINGEENYVNMNPKKGNAEMGVTVYLGEENGQYGFEVNTVGLGGDTISDICVLPRYVKGWDYDTATPSNLKVSDGEEVYAMFKDIESTTPEEVASIIENSFKAADNSPLNISEEYRSIAEQMEKDIYRWLIDNYEIDLKDDMDLTYDIEELISGYRSAIFENYCDENELDLIWGYELDSNAPFGVRVFIDKA